VTEQQKTNKIARITQQLAALKEQTNKANAETKAHIEKRDKLNEQFGKVRQGIYELVNERNGLNEAVKTLKQERDQVRTVIQANIEEIKMHRQKLIELKKKRPSRAIKSYKKNSQISNGKSRLRRSTCKKRRG